MFFFVFRIWYKVSLCLNSFYNANWFDYSTAYDFIKCTTTTLGVNNLCQFSSVSNISPDPGNKYFYSHGLSFCATSSNNIKCIHDITVEVSEKESKIIYTNIQFNN